MAQRPRKPTTRAARPRKRSPSDRATVWMYRQGLGDCFLIRLPLVEPGAGRSHFFIMIDCGVVLGTPDAAARMIAVLKDIRTRLGEAGHLDLLIATHEHWDHLSGFLQARDELEGLTVGEVWLAWTEDPEDELARKLAAEKSRALAALRLAASHMRLAGDAGRGAELEGVLEFFGAAKGMTTADALAVVRRLGGDHVRYLRPGEAPITRPELGQVRFFVLGPPRDQKLLRRTNPRKGEQEAYGMALDLFLDHVEPGLVGAATSPFHPMHAIPLEVAAEMDFFKTHYWEAGSSGEAWRRIDLAWLEGSTELALQLDAMTNNTSLVLALELPGGDVLLFAADAQVGSWLSWQDLRWETENGTVTGPDLLRRTVFYKVGHHGSHNATLREKGLELMTGLQIAVVPVDHAMALKKRWTRIPLEELMDELERRIPGRVLRSDQTEPLSVRGRISTTDLHFEINF